MKRTTCNGMPGMTAEYFSRRDEATGCDDRRGRRLTEEQIRGIVRDELLAILEEARQT